MNSRDDRDGGCIAHGRDGAKTYDDVCTRPTVGGCSVIRIRSSTRRSAFRSFRPLTRDCRATTTKTRVGFKCAMTLLKATRRSRSLLSIRSSSNVYSTQCWYVIRLFGDSMYTVRITKTIIINVNADNSSSSLITSIRINRQWLFELNNLYKISNPVYGSSRIEPGETVTRVLLIVYISRVRNKRTRLFRSENGVFFATIVTNNNIACPRRRRVSHRWYALAFSVHDTCCGTRPALRLNANTPTEINSFRLRGCSIYLKRIVLSSSDHVPLVANFQGARRGSTHGIQSDDTSYF